MQDNAPAWLKENDEYLPLKDRDSFINSSAKKVMSALSHLKHNGTSQKATRVNTSLRLIGVLLAIILTSASHNFYFVFVMVAFTVVSLALSNGKVIKGVFKVLIPAIIFTLIILAPAVFLGNAHTMLSVTARVFVSVTLVMRLNLTTPWNKITSSLKAFHIPDIIIFTFDTTIHYIAILGDLCFDMLTALKVRSIGKDNNKKSAISGILGTTVIKARENAQLTNQAMECRGFNGEFVVSHKKGINKFDLLYIIGMVALLGVFIYFEVVMK
jgi:cobalt/nickel transport system permease protein